MKSIKRGKSFLLKEKKKDSSVYWNDWVASLYSIVRANYDKCPIVYGEVLHNEMSLPITKIFLFINTANP